MSQSKLVLGSKVYVESLEVRLMKLEASYWEVLCSVGQKLIKKGGSQMKDLKFSFELNEMQLKARRLTGKNIFVTGPTGSGKTEAILCNMKDGAAVYYYLLPMITSCLFMYNRLKGMGLNVEVRTSKLSEVSNGNHSKIIITTPDQLMIKWLKDYSCSGLNLILDELDNYPVMVQSAIIDYINSPLNNGHIIIASATIDGELASTIRSKCKEIGYKLNSDIPTHYIHHRVLNIPYLSYHDKEIIGDIIKTNKNKKIGFIFNSIRAIEYFIDEIEFSNRRVLVLHGALDDYDRLQAEQKLFEGDYDIIVSNDIISMSIDIDLDILFTEPTDRLNLLLQRLGRCNRYNKPISSDNVYLIDSGITPRFIDSEIAEELASKIIDESYLSIDKRNTLRSSLPVIELPTVDHIINTYWEELESDGFSLNLREVPYEFKEAVSKNVNGKIINTYKSYKVNKDNGMPWSYLEYNSKGERVYVRLNRSTYEIIGREEDVYIVEEVGNILSYGYCECCKKEVSSKDFDFSYGCCKDCREEW